MKKDNITKVTLIMLILVLSLVGFAGCKHEDDENIDTDVPETEEPVAPEVTEDIVIPDDVVETSSLDIDSMSQEEVANAYYTALISGDYDTAYTQVPHSPDMTTGVSPAVYEQIMTGLIASTGEFKELISYDVLEDPGYMIYEFHTQFENMPLTLRVVMIDKVVYGFNYAEYVPDEDVSKEPYTYEEREVTFGDTAYPLSGTLTIPNNLETYPIVILVQGSGPNDRDETIGPNKPFQDIAMALADAGIASLRYDKRTFTYGQELMTDTTLTVYDETIVDVILAVDFLRNNEAVLYNQLYVAGHSLGGYVIPRINELTDNVSGYIMLAANARPLEELVPIQLEYVKGTMTSISSEEQAYFDAIYADLALLE
ncbi:MAG: hypothetical protein PF505_08535, partial [Vallitaleaceae bacterium]|nr:hypothetical protein [Vallitaleaceae bacterium]